MILGMSIPTFTFVHTALSLVGIFTGLIVLFWGCSVPSASKGGPQRFC